MILTKENRNTIQRKLIWEALKRLNHPTADDVYLAVRENYPNISRGTVYRNLNQIAEKGELQKIPIPSGPDIYDVTLRPHYHIKCRRCKKIYDVEMEDLPDISRYITDKHGFVIENHEIVFQGLCPKCNKNGGYNNE